MKEFILFLKFFLLYFWFCRAVIIALIGIICVNALLFAYVEDKAIFTSMYFILITALTIGYGDITPITACGKMLSIGTGFIGVIMMGLIIAISNQALINAVRAGYRRRAVHGPGKAEIK